MPPATRTYSGVSGVIIHCPISVSWATVAGALLCSCDAPTDPHAPWSALRDALSVVKAPPEVLALAADIERGDRADVTARLDGDHAAADRTPGGLAWLGRIDRARARAGHDALVAAQLVRDGEALRALPCADLLGDLARVDLDAWLASCPAPPDGPVERVVAPGMPALAVWLPAERRVLIHPVMLVHLATSAPGEPLATVTAPLVAGDDGCPAALDAWCDRCPLGSEAGCDPLFGPATAAVACAALDAIEPSPFADTPAPWRGRYCAWRGTVEEPWVRFTLLSGAYLGQGGTCWDPAVPVVDEASLRLAFPWQGDCASALTQAHLAIAEDRELVVEAPLFKSGTFWRPFPLRMCADYVERVTCVACTPDPEAQCVGAFANSSAAGDCLALRRAEAAGGGFAAYCALAYAAAFLNRDCVNLYDKCFDGRFFGAGSASFEQLVGVFPGFFDPRTRDRCIDQYQACLDGSPYHDLDLQRPIPTAIIDSPAASDDAKCPL